jgi:hypothetical protein
MLYQPSPSAAVAAAQEIIARVLEQVVVPSAGRTISQLFLVRLTQLLLVQEATPEEQEPVELAELAISLIQILFQLTEDSERFLGAPKTVPAEPSSETVEALVGLGVLAETPDLLVVVVVREATPAEAVEAVET